MRKYPTRYHCSRHLTRTTTCLAALQLCAAPLPEDESNNLDELDIVTKKLHSKVKKNGQSARQIFTQLAIPSPIDFQLYHDLLENADDG